ncbi:MAG TPA: hypothetical protein VLH84_02890 [Patescibacteria group bacterium]|nr:hypothetical protein [Patescibacteria group bacterium]
MTYHRTEQTLGVLNRGLQARYEDGDPIRLDINGKPKLHVVSFQPLAYEIYGIISNRAPSVAGSLVLRMFLTAPHPEGGATIYAGLEADRAAYGFEVDYRDESVLDAIHGVAAALGHPDFRLALHDPTVLV